MPRSGTRVAAAATRDASPGPIDWQALTSGFAVLGAAAVEIGAGYAIWQRSATNAHVLAMALSLACYLAGLGTLVVGPMRELSVDARERIAGGGLLFAAFAYGATILLFRETSYGTDSLLFNAYSAELVLRGIDPYTQNLHAAYDIFGVPDTLITPTISGQPVYALSYPALSFLVYVPFLAIGVHDLLWIDLALHLAALAVLYVMAPRGLRAIAMLVLFVDTAYIEYTVGSVTDVVWVVPMLFAAFWWRRFPVRAALMLGIACSVKQTPWLIVPFGLWAWADDAIRRRNWRAFANPSAALLLAFATPNAPFILWHPAAWLAGSLTPFDSNLVAFGSGLVQLTTSNAVAIPRSAYGLYTAVALALCFACYVAFRRRLEHLPFVAPGIVLFFASRSLHNYFMFWPVVLVAFLFGPVARYDVLAVMERVRPRPLWVTAAAGVALALGVAAEVRAQSLAVQPTTLVITDHAYDPVSRQVDAVTFDLRNADSRQHIYRFGLVQQGVGVAVRYWERTLATLPARSSKTITIRTAEQGEELPASADRASQVVAIDALSGDAFDSPAQIFRPNGAGFVNPSLAAWRGPVPVGWNASEQDVAAGKLSRVRGDDAVRYSVRRARDGAWNIATLIQTVYMLESVVHVRLRPDADYAGDAYPHAIFGVELVDPNGLHSYYAIDSRLKAPIVYRRDQFIVHVLPGTLHAWNDVAIDLDELASASGFSAGAHAQYQFSVVDAVFADYGGMMSGDFGGVR